MRKKLFYLSNVKFDKRFVKFVKFDKKFVKYVNYDKSFVKFDEYIIFKNNKIKNL